MERQLENKHRLSFGMCELIFLSSVLFIFKEYHFLGYSLLTLSIISGLVRYTISIHLVNLEIQEYAKMVELNNLVLQSSLIGNNDFH